MKIALLGAGGQLAHDLRQALARHQVVPLARTDLDICDPQAVERILTALAPQLVVNTAAYNLVDQAESEPAVAFQINGIGPLVLARACQRLGAAVCHFSTDYVFGLDGARKDPWRETDPPGPVSVYGTSKLAGESLVQAYCPRHYLIRTCGLYGIKGSRGKGGNFVETMLRLAGQGKTVRVVNDQVCTPSFAGDVARMTADLIETESYGLYHLTSAGQCTWFEFAREIFQQSGLAVECVPIGSAEFGAPARRPPFSVLSTQRIEALGIHPPPWRDALARYLDQRRRAPG